MSEVRITISERALALIIDRASQEGAEEPIVLGDYPGITIEASDDIVQFVMQRIPALIALAKHGEPQ